MSSSHAMIERAFRRLASRPGYRDRPDQLHLALLLSDMISGEGRGLFEAPTGLGKSLAALVPAIVHARLHGRRVVIATYTNVLAEQYWREDLPLALSLFDGEEEGLPARGQLLMGRQRYACLAAMEESAPSLVAGFRARAELGIETEFRQAIVRPQRELGPLWRSVVAPPVCPGRLCPHYNACFYYRARRAADEAEIVLTNHSVVIQDALLADASDHETSLLGNYDFLILDEAHDFPQAAENGLEFELSRGTLSALSGTVGRLERTLQPHLTGERSLEWMKLSGAYRGGLERWQRELAALGVHLGRTGILVATPSEVLDHPQAKAAKVDRGVDDVARMTIEFGEETLAFVKAAEDLIAELKKDGSNLPQAAEWVRSYLAYVREFGLGAMRLMSPEGVAVTYAGDRGGETFLRQDVIGLADPLRELIWNRRPYACLSATLILDGSFDFFRRTSGAQPDFEEVLPSPFDHATQAALYLPPRGAIPDPSEARKQGLEEAYFDAVADELGTLIRAVGGRTLALFHSRREMEAVMQRMDLPPELPLLMQHRSGAGSVGERFKRDERTSLFALRSFWTGFDAPGETLSCVALVRVPFEVPVDPPQIARMAWLQGQGLNPFGSHSLPLAKMLMRQGAGRLIRRDDDRGIIAILDPRLQTKRYGEEILENLPPEMRRFTEVEEAVGFLGLDPAGAGRS
jgi:ATP-dependent DNA helicase DinG